MKTNTEIEKTLNSLDSLQKAEIHPFLYEKIKYRLQNEKQETTIRFALSWKLAAVLALIVFIIVFTCIKYSKQEVPQNTNYSSNNTVANDEYYYNTGYNY